MILYNASSSYYSMIARYALIEEGIPFESKRMDIHLAKEQLSAWYMKINPAMTVPTLVDGEQLWTDSQDILKFAAHHDAGQEWMDDDERFALQIDELVREHYAISIERLTFGKAFTSIPPLKFFALKMLSNAVEELEAKLSTTTDKTALESKIYLNKQRLAYFNEGNLADKLQNERDTVRNFIDKLPTPHLYLFGDNISSVDIVTVVLFSRLQMIKEYGLVQSPELKDWFKRMQLRPNYKQADIWTYFQPWRILFKR